MDFIRFSGELFIYHALIAFGGGVFTAILLGLFKAIGINAEPFVQLWLIPCGATDTIALWAIGSRITEFGFSPKRVAVLGMNLILLVNLSWSAVVYIRFLRGQSGAFATLERWQTRYLPVNSVWAAVVVIVFPLVFGYV